MLFLLIRTFVLDDTCFVFTFVPFNYISEMKVQVNNKEVDTHSTTLLELVTELSLPAQGIAVAVNNQLVPRTQWNTFRLQENDALVIIKAACGG